MRSLRTNIKVLSGVLGMLALQTSTNAQVNIVDTIGNGSRWGIGLSRSNGAAVGIDPGGVIAPQTAAAAGYAVLPFTIASTGAVTSLSQVDIVFNIQPPTLGVNSNVPALSGAIVAANGSGSLSLTGLSSSDFFSFDTSVNVPPANLPNSGDGITHVYSAKNLGGYALNSSQTYWLIVAPKKGLGAQTGDTLLDFGLWNYRTAADVAASAASLTNAYASVDQGLAEKSGANAGDTLSPTTIGVRGPVPAFFGARISGTVVPEPSSLLSLAGGVLLSGGLLLRRRKA